MRMHICVYIYMYIGLILQEYGALTCSVLVNNGIVEQAGRLRGFCVLRQHENLGSLAPGRYIEKHL